MTSIPALSQIYTQSNQHPEIKFEDIVISAERKFDETIDVAEAGEIVETVRGFVAAGEPWYKALDAVVVPHYPPKLTVVSS
jgi:hypothetical protein